VGLPVVENAREVLTSLYKRTLDETAARFPADIAYRKYVESFTKYRLSVLERSATIEEFEEEVGMGQIEELIEEAEDELEAMKVYHARRFWEPMPGDTDTTKPRIEFVFSGETEAEIQEALVSASPLAARATRRSRAALATAQKYAASVNKSRAAAAGAGGAASAAGTVPPAGAAAKP
jgi:hypothetical protein